MEIILKNTLYILLIYNSLILFILFIFFINFIINLKKFKQVFSYKINFIYEQTLPKVSVLIPARNEEKNIEACVRSLLEQDYNNYEIIILDDNSTDDTQKIVKNIIEENNLSQSLLNDFNNDNKKINLKLIIGKPLLNGWVGKNYACYQLEKAASGSYLLFTDADTVHGPESISSGLQCLISNNLDALSVYPELIMKSFIEKMVIGFMKFGILLFLPLYVRKKISKLMFHPALGSYMLYKRDVYNKIGGHKQIYNKCLEDMNMAKLITNNGYKFAIFDGMNIYKTRMYNNFKDLYKGFSRFIITTFNYNKILPLILNLAISVLLLFPFLLLISYPFFYSFEFQNYFMTTEIINLLNRNIILTLMQISLILFIKTIYISRFEGSIIDLFLHPISIAIILIMGIALSFGGKKTSKISWKGREYCLNNCNNIKG